MKTIIKSLVSTFLVCIIMFGVFWSIGCMGSTLQIVFLSICGITGLAYVFGEFYSYYNGKRKS